MARKKVHYYWTGWVDYGIQKYLSTDNQHERNKIYRKYLQEPFEKMCEIVTKRWKWNYIPTDLDDLKHELVSHMISKMHNYNPNKGKSFGYFTLILKNYLIQMNNKLYKYTISHTDSNDHSDIVMNGYRVHRNSWQNVVEIINKTENFHNYIDFLDKHGKSILKHPHNEIITPLVDYVKDIDNTKHQGRNDFINHIKSHTSFDNHLLFQTTHLVKNLYRKFINKVQSAEEMERWIKLLIWKQK